MREVQKRDFTKIVDELLERGSSVSDIKRDLLNKKLNDFVNDYLTENERKDCLRLYEYIFNLVNDKPVISFKYNSDTVDCINKEIMSELFPQYSESRLETSEFEQLVDELRDAKESLAVQNSSLRNDVANLQDQIGQKDEVISSLNQSNNADTVLRSLPYWSQGRQS
jgi:hypothetical protein